MYFIVINIFVVLIYINEIFPVYFTFDTYFRPDGTK
jgi:hypothetical protein